MDVQEGKHLQDEKPVRSSPTIERGERNLFLRIKGINLQGEGYTPHAEQRNVAGLG
jgi:hypothetical protein